MQSKNKRRDREIIRVESNRDQALELLQFIGGEAREGLGVARCEEKGNFAEGSGEGAVTHFGIPVVENSVF